MKQILFVCTGNTCRSPMAAAIVKAMDQEGFDVQSAGIFASNGSDASPHTKRVLSENNMECSHSSQPLTEELIEWATHIFTMTEGHKWQIETSFPSAKSKTFTLKEYVGEKGDIMDPFGGDLEVYRMTYSELISLIKKAIKKLENEK
ncbi:protein arginine phosphatase PrpB [Bacillus carboniphilus]|uniref:Protein arginine phosphatase PrpB n=1 Tax=Bacillus carboniphilus TaxID=86663 RepID=A0ABN0VXZ0_9BACI